MESLIVGDPEVNNVRTEIVELPATEKDQNDLERKAFRSDLERQQAKQLESLEQRFAGFADFARKRKIGKELSTHQKRRLAVGRKTLQSIENHRANVANNNQENDDYFDESPSYIKGVMRDYQVKGLNWLISLYENGMSGILADEMGLGKTIQSISMIGYLMHVRKFKGPFLIVVPLTTINNWMEEFARFLPTANVLRGHATGGEKQAVLIQLRAKNPRWNVVVTTYEFIVQNKLQFMKLNFHYAIIDEGHRAKNELTQFPVVLRKCKIQGMVMLTGTPIHNNLHELWALLNLLMPLFFDSADNFDSWFKVEDCVDPQHEQTRRLQNLLKPIMLRRVKAEVCKDIPPKVRILLCVPPTKEICEWSRKVLQHDVVQLNPDGTYHKFRMGNVFSFLRQVVLHPFLIPGSECIDGSNLVSEQIVEASAKMIVLDKLLTRLKRRGSKVLIFSQFVVMQQILWDYFDWKEYQYCSITGSTSVEDRQKQMEEFNRPNSKKFIFALTTRAGGLGINLTAADSVIFYDMDWNPQMDFQAEDRAHRIGQRKKVHVYRLLVRGTVDELLHTTAERKKQLDESVIRYYLTKKLEHEATIYHQEKLMTVGIIDRSVVDEKLDALFHEMDTNDGLQENSVIVLPGVPHADGSGMAMYLHKRGTGEKRKPEEDLILTGKRYRMNSKFYGA